jgi:hypothetical protein
MSCYLVNENRINAIARHIAPQANVSAAVLAEMMAVANLEAVVHRYGDRHGPVAGGFLNTEADVTDYIYSCIHGEASTDCVFDLIGEYVYQACDHNNWENLPIRHYINGGQA